MRVFLNRTQTTLSLTRRGKWRLDFGPWSYWLDRSRLLGGKLLQADPSLLKHLLDRALFLENFVYQVLMEDGGQSSDTATYVVGNTTTSMSD